MRTIQMTLDDDLVTAVDGIVKKLKNNPFCFCAEGVEGGCPAGKYQAA